MFSKGRTQRLRYSPQHIQVSCVAVSYFQYTFLPMAWPSWWFQCTFTFGWYQYPKLDQKLRFWYFGHLNHRCKSFPVFLCDGILLGFGTSPMSVMPTSWGVVQSFDSASFEGCVCVFSLSHKRSIDKNKSKGLKSWISKHLQSYSLRYAHFILK